MIIHIFGTQETIYIIHIIVVPGLFFFFKACHVFLLSYFVILAMLSAGRLKQTQTLDIHTCLYE